ncbi:hypothetical protein QE152_g32165 [Popillia japonica]|uniref:Uncharacterized protein n=1 Tax=Popillia japonica TaxID=7064 RepID=A0AAW1IZZ8_POPJA
MVRACVRKLALPTPPSPSHPDTLGAELAISSYHPRVPKNIDAAYYIDGMEDPNGSVQDGTGRHNDNLPAAHYECRFEVG